MRCPAPVGGCGLAAVASALPDAAGVCVGAVGTAGAAGAVVIGSTAGLAVGLAATAAAAALAAPAPGVAALAFRVRPMARAQATEIASQACDRDAGPAAIWICIRLILGQGPARRGLRHLYPRCSCTQVVSSERPEARQAPKLNRCQKRVNSSSFDVIDPDAQLNARRRQQGVDEVDCDRDRCRYLKIFGLVTRRRKFASTMCSAGANATCSRRIEMHAASALRRATDRSSHPQARINVLLPNRLSIRSTASTAVLLRTSSAGLSSITSRLARRPLSAIISMHSCASR